MSWLESELVLFGSCTLCDAPSWSITRSLSLTFQRLVTLGVVCFFAVHDLIFSIAQAIS